MRSSGCTTFVLDRLTALPYSACDFTVLVAFLTHVEFTASATCFSYFKTTLLRAEFSTFLSAFAGLASTLHSPLPSACRYGPNFPIGPFGSMESLPGLLIFQIAIRFHSARLSAAVGAYRSARRPTTLLTVYPRHLQLSLLFTLGGNRRAENSERSQGCSLQVA